MRILQVGPESAHVEAYLNELVKVEKDVFFLGEKKCNYLSEGREFVANFKSWSPLKLVLEYRKLIKLLRKIKPRIIHIHQVNRAAFFVIKAAKKLKIPVVLTAWGSDVLLMPKKNILYKSMTQFCLKNAAYITADAEHMIAEMKHLEPNTDKYVHLQYGITPIEGIEKEKIVYSNRILNPLYRIDQIIDYFIDFQKEHKEWKLVIGATGTEEERLKAKVKELNLEEQIHFVGWLKNEENRKWYSKSAIYISIPESDGTSVSVLEAMSAGCIPVVPDLPVSQEWIVDHENGIIEKKGENPLIEALEIDVEKCQQRNSDLIHKNATRQASITIFQSLYGKA
jgi:glycosyltransferase involved in cell wall biosynthesis